MSRNSTPTPSSSALRTPLSPPATPDLSDPKYPAVQPGGSLLVAYQVRNKPVLVVGGGNVAAGRILSLLNADAVVHVACPLSGCCPEVIHRLRTSPIIHHNQNFHPTLLDKIQPVIVLTAIDSPEASTEIYKLCHRLRIPVNVADVPPECDFYFGSVHRDGPLQIMVSTNGNGPKLANIVRRQIAGQLPENLGEAIVRVGQLRKRLRKIAQGQEQGAKRMEWMSSVCEKWSLEELCQMGEVEMGALLEGYKEGKVMSLREIRGESEEDWTSATEPEETDSEDEEERNKDRVVFEEAFDGSFGWFCG
ncbi:hypothetical protein BZA77DRAFT_362013 [Pyronema omphalodes]|nr:hypothetical protein BZA77DRAFT_362013 [Pyronema omphalodes]